MGIHEVDRGLGADVAVPPSSIEAESNNYFRKISEPRSLSTLRYRAFSGSVGNFYRHQLGPLHIMNLMTSLTGATTKCALYLKSPKSDLTSKNLQNDQIYQENFQKNYITKNEVTKVKNLDAGNDCQSGDLQLLQPRT